MVDLRNSCGGTGCNTPEHEKRLGTDNLIVYHVDMENQVVMANGALRAGSLVAFLKNKFGDDWQDVHITQYMDLKFNVAN
jgi:hypothetical protein